MRSPAERADLRIKRVRSPVGGAARRIMRTCKTLPYGVMSPGGYPERYKMDRIKELEGAVCEGEEEAALEVVGLALEEGVDPLLLLEEGAVAGIYEAGRLWQEGSTSCRISFSPRKRTAW